MKSIDQSSIFCKVSLLALSLLAISCSARKSSVEDICKSRSGPISISSEASLSAYLSSAPDSKSLSVDQLSEQLSQSWATGIALQDSDGSNSFVANNCMDIVNVGDDLEPVRPSEFTPYQILRTQCQAVALIVDAIPATRSCVDKLSFDESMVDLFPKDLAFITSRNEKARVQEDVGISSWSDVNPIQSVESINEEKWVLSIPGGRQEVTLMAKADFNADGDEDILLRIVNQVETGSYTHAALYILTRTEAPEDYRLIRSFE